MLPTSPFNETHWNPPHYIDLYKQANATADPATRKQIEHEMMQMIDFNQGGYIIPAFIAALDAYSTKITGTRPPGWASRLSDFDFEHFYFVVRLIPALTDSSLESGPVLLALAASVSRRARR